MLPWRPMLCVLLPFAAGYYLSYLFRSINALIAGELTVKEVAIPVVLEAKFQGTGKDVYGVEKTLFRVQGEIEWGPTRVEITADNVAVFLRSQQKLAGNKELYLLILYPRVARGVTAYPLKSQREMYDRWFEGVPHGYDIPVRAI